MTEPIKGCPQPDAPELVMRADGYHYKSEDEMKELTFDQLDEIWEGLEHHAPVYMARAAIAADRALNAEDHDPLEPKRLESIADPTLRAVCETYTNTPGGHFMRLQAIAKLVPAPADRAPRTYEQEYAIKEGHRNKIEDDYFDARTVFDLAPRPCFKDGFDRGWDAAKKDAPVDRKHQPAGTPVAWLLTDKKINDIQVDSVQRLIDRARQAHFTDLIIRINGKDEHYQADWLKHLVRAEVPVCAPADRDVMRQVPEGWKMLAAAPTPPAEQQEEQEPAAFIQHHKAGDNLVWDDPGGKKTALYTHPSPSLAEQQGEQQSGAPERGGILGLVETHPNYVAGFKAAFQSMRPRILAELRAKVEALPGQPHNNDRFISLNDVLSLLGDKQ